MSTSHPRRQTTLAAETEVKGYGYWTGDDVRVRLKPALPDTGLVVIRDDLPGAPELHVHVGGRIEAQRRTVLARGEVKAEMVEHVLAALHGMGVDNCRISINGPELPGCDGSALAFVNAIRQVGIVEQTGSPRTLVVKETIRVGDESSWIEARPPVVPGEFTVDVTINYEKHPIIGRQRYALRVTPETFASELAPCRTFVLKHEADWLRSQGLAPRATTSDLLIFDQNGPMDNPLRFADECVRHKALDLVGDLALVGCRVQGRFVAYCTGHRQNADLVWSLLNEADPMRLRRRSA